jgi:hypothetical protein
VKTDGTPDESIPCTTGRVSDIHILFYRSNDPQTEISIEIENDTLNLIKNAYFEI